MYWIVRYIRYHGIRHPQTMGTTEVEAFLTHLAVEGRVAASTQYQAPGAWLFLYREVLRQDIGLLDAVRARRLPAASPGMNLSSCRCRQQTVQPTIPNLSWPGTPPCSAA